MAQRLRSRATAAVAAGLAAACIALTAGPAVADTVRNQEWWLSSLHVTKAWLSSRGAGVTVAVLDTGVAPGQADLTGSVTTGADFTGSGRAPGSPLWGTHGTAVASLIAGHGHGRRHASGIIGIAPMAKILSVRVTVESTDPLLASPTSVASLAKAIGRGIRYALKQGAQDIHRPLDPAALSAGAGGSASEASAVAAALRQGVVLVAPAGDGGAGANTVNYPAAYPGVIAVGAFDQNFTKAAFTSQQPYVTLTGPGSAVIAANGPHGYAPLKSTSAASAVVAGIAALIRSQFPTLTPAQVTQALTSGTVFRPKGGKQSGSGYGTADASAALIAAAQINAALPSSKPSAGNAGPTPPAAPLVKVPTKSLWDTLRVPVLGVAAILLLGLIVLIVVRVRQRRALDAQLAPLRAAARASRKPPLTETASPGNAPVGSGSLSAGAGAGGHLGAGSAGSGSLGPGYAGRGATGPGSVSPQPVSGAPPWVVQSAAQRPGTGEPAEWATAGHPAVAQPGADRPSVSSPGGGATRSGRAGGGSMGGQAGPGGPAANSSPAGRPAFGPAPSGDPSFDIPPFDRPSFNEPPFSESSFSGPGFGGSPFDDRSFGSAAADGPSARNGSASRPPLGNGAPGAPPSGNGSPSAPPRGNGSPSQPPWGDGSTSERPTENGSPGQPPWGKGASSQPPPGNSATSDPPRGKGASSQPVAENGSRSVPPWGKTPRSERPFGNSSTSEPPFANTATGEPPARDSSASEPPADSAAAEPPFGTAAGRPRLGRPAGDDLPPGIAPFDGAPFGGTPFGSPGSATRGGPAPNAAPPAGASFASAPLGRAPQGGAPSGNTPPGSAAPGPGVLGRPPAGEPPISPGRPLGAAHRLSPPRTPKSSGHPPWSPAEKPDGELPWMDTPPPGGAHSRLIPPRRAFPGSAAAVPGTGAPEASAPETGPDQGDLSREPISGGRDPGRRGNRDRGPFPELDEPPSGGLGDPMRGAPGEDANTAPDRPIYAWNPSDTTEAFPKVMPPEEGR